MKYEFSAPLPYKIEDIDKIIEINKQVNESKITCLYGCLPYSCNYFTGFEQARNFFDKNSSIDYWKNLIDYTLSSGFDFIYLLNSPRPFSLENDELKKQFERLEKLISILKETGTTKLRVAACQLMTYISKHYPDFQVLASTSLEYKTIWEYQNFIHFHPEVKQIVPSHDVNKNFILLKNLRKRYPNMELELMVNEGCLQGCPHRNIHENSYFNNDIFINDDMLTNQAYFSTYFCHMVSEKYAIQNFIIGNLIFPSEIKEYSKLGIKKFKFVGRDSYNSSFDDYKNFYLYYLRGIDNVTNIEDCSFNVFSHHLSHNRVLKQMKIKDYIKYFPNINHFKKYGHLCASRCGVECRYCYKCAEKIQKVFEKKQQEQRKRNIPVCIIK